MKHPCNPASVDQHIEALRRALAHTGPLISETVPIPGANTAVTVTRPADTDRLLDQSAADPEQNLPYWAEIWPAGIALAAAIAAHPDRIRGRRVLELGSGLGITAAIALAHGADLTITDYAAESLLLTRLTCIAHTGREPEAAVRANWRDASVEALVRGGRFDVVLGADLLYERRDIEPLLTAIEPLVATDGALWLAEPGREPAHRFLDRLASRGWLAESTAWSGPWPDPKDHGVVARSHWMRRATDPSLDKSEGVVR